MRGLRCLWVFEWSGVCGWRRSRWELVIGVFGWGVFGVSFEGFWWLVIKGLWRLMILSLGLEFGFCSVW